MQEHIRRAHPEHYIAKLPATEESFLLMVNSPPAERRPDGSSASATQGLFPFTSDRCLLHFPADARSGFHDRHTYYRDDSSNPVTPRHSDELAVGGNSMIGAANAAAALAELHSVKSERDFDLDGVCLPAITKTTPRSIDITRCYR